MFALLVLIFTSSLASGQCNIETHLVIINFETAFDKVFRHFGGGQYA